jgi:hypothetical protein
LSSSTIASNANPILFDDESAQVAETLGALHRGLRDATALEHEGGSCVMGLLRRTLELRNFSDPMTPALSAIPDRAHGNRRDSLPKRHPHLFHACWHCHQVGLKPGILATKHGDYGVRKSFEDEAELQLNEAGLCQTCAEQLRMGDSI